MRRFIAILLVCLMICPAAAEEAKIISVETMGSLEGVASDTELFEHPEEIFLGEGEEIIRTENTYKSQNIAIEITSMRYENSDVYIADIYVRSVANFQRAYAGGKWKKTTDKVKDMAAENNAVLAMTGDSGQVIIKGWCIGNGVTWRSTTNKKRDIAILFKNGELKTYPGPVDYTLLEPLMDDIWHSFLFGPVLLDAEGKAMKKFNSDVGLNNPRSAIGYYEPGHYCFVQVDGRKTKSALEAKKINKGITLKALSKLMEELGCTSAYNLDGGRSSMMYFGEGLISTPDKGGRRIGDIVLIKELE